MKSIMISKVKSVACGDGSRSDRGWGAVWGGGG